LHRVKTVTEELIWIVVGLSLRRITMPDIFGKLKSSQFSKLGGIVYEKFSKQEAIDPALVEFCQAIAQLHQQVGLKNEEISKIKAETFSASPAAPAPTPAQTPTVPETAPVDSAPQAQPEAKHCPNCGKEAQPDEKFCKDCGTKL
jgi:hypothetical protein